MNTLTTHLTSDELRPTLIERCKSSLYFFTKAILNYSDLGPLHNDFCNTIQQNLIHRKSGYLMPRGHFKSTVVAKSYPLWRLLSNPDLRILIVGETEKVASKNLKDIKHNIEKNDLLRWLFPHLIPTTSCKWTTTEIVLPRSKSYDESTITCIGVGSQTTGFHYDLIIYDDMIGEDAASSPALMQEAIEWYKLAPGLMNNPATCEELLIGTRWLAGEADLYGYIQAHNPSHSPDGFHWYQRAALEDSNGLPSTTGLPIFPERFTQATLASIKQRQGDYVFSCQYQNQPVNPGTTDFPQSSLQYYHVLDGKIHTSSGSQHKLRDLYRWQFYDFSSGGASAKCDGAIIVLGADSSHNIYVLDTYIKNTSAGEALEQMHVFADRYHTQKNYYEDIGAQKTIEDIERERQSPCRHCGKKHTHFTLTPFKPPTGRTGPAKNDRIRLYLKDVIRDKRLFLRRDQTELISQIIQFPYHAKADGLDALASGVVQAYYPPSPDDLEALKVPKVLISQSRIHTHHSYGGYI